MNLKESGHHNELRNGYLYGKLRTKLTESMLAKYHRWVFETRTPESVVALKIWVFEESAFQTIASEAVHGITGNIGNTSNMPSQDTPTCNSQRTFFGEMIDHCSIKNTSCQVYGRDHKIWTCQKTMEKTVSGRWDTAKSSKLCFRCLGDGHIGKACRRSRPCGQNGCQKLHHVLLHSNDNRQCEAKSKRCLLNRSNRTVVGHNTPDAERVESNNILTDRGTSGTEGNDQTQDLPMQTQDGCTADTRRRLPAVPVRLTQGDRRRKIDNAIIIKPCSGADNAAELERQYTSENITGNRKCVLHSRETLAHLIGTKEEEKPRCIEPLKQKVVTQTAIAHVYQDVHFEEGKTEIRDFGYVDNIVVLGRNVHDVMLL